MNSRFTILHIAKASAEGGREGHARTRDRRFAVDRNVPSARVGPDAAGTNHERLFAGYAACFQSSMQRFSATGALNPTAQVETA
jgi:organic hydroperoxide reductase OsmC/OhrA